MTQHNFEIDTDRININADSMTEYRKTLQGAMGAVSDSEKRKYLASMVMASRPHSRGCDTVFLRGMLTGYGIISGVNLATYKQMDRIISYIKRK